MPLSKLRILDLSLTAMLKAALNLGSSLTISGAKEISRTPQNKSTGTNKEYLRTWRQGVARRRVTPRFRPAECIYCESWILFTCQPPIRQGARIRSYTEITVRHSIGQFLTQRIALILSTS